MSFTDSPEDLIAKARRIANAGKVTVDEESIAVPGAVCVLLNDVARALELERDSRARTAEIIKQTNIREGQALHALELVKAKLRALRASTKRKPKAKARRR